MNQDFPDLLRAFIDRDVRFLIVGAYALGVHGRPRATGDLDVWVDPTPDISAPFVPRAFAAYPGTEPQAASAGCSTRSRT
jgi:hypothetical protein